MNHLVTNQPPPLEDDDLFDPVLSGLVQRHGGGAHLADLAAFGKLAGAADHRRLGELANRYEPVLHTHDRFGRRVDEVEFHHSWHELVDTSVSAGMHSVCWTAADGGWVARAAFNFMDSQIEAGHWCPISMTGAAVGALRHEPALAAEWEPRILARTYDPQLGSAKPSALIGMGMTEKQGGSDVRANTTVATTAGDGNEYRVNGHKWFTSAPMCDAFLILAQAAGGVTCFLLPRLTPDGQRNGMHIQRLKDKLGNRSNASSELELHDAWVRRVGEEGRGVRTIIEMVTATRLDCIAGSAALMRQAVSQAIHHTRYRHAFGTALIDKPLMRNVLADLEIEVRAALHLTMRVAETFDGAGDDPGEAALRRILTPIAKYWVTKQCTGVVREALECLGGNGYVEDSGLPRLFRESPLNAIWEGSGNVIALDVLRVAARQPGSVDALAEFLERGRGADPALDHHLDAVRALVSEPEDPEWQARRIAESLALAVQAVLLLDGDPRTAEAFVASRIAAAHGPLYGTLPSAASIDHLLA
ncbi:acyl-CoA dehydrogenase family protein [soil metagenome]